MVNPVARMCNVVSYFSMIAEHDMKNYMWFVNARVNIGLIEGHSH